jgi:hypothetical protein
VGGAEGKLKLTAEHICLKVNLKYELTSDQTGTQKLKLNFKVTNINHDIPERYLKLHMEGNTAANLLSKAADLAKSLILDKLVKQMTSSIEELLKNNLPKIL